MAKSSTTTWHGTGKDKEESLIGNGLLVRYDRARKSYQCLFRIKMNRYGLSYVSEREVDETVFQDWFDKNKFQEFIKSSLMDWSKKGFTEKLQDILGFLGANDTFGLSSQVLDTRTACKMARVDYSPEYMYC